MSPPRSFDDLWRVGSLIIAPVFREPLDSPYEISNELYAALRHVCTTSAASPTCPLPYMEKEKRSGR